MSATHAVQSTLVATPVLYIAFELSLGTWKIAFTVGWPGQWSRIRSVNFRYAPADYKMRRFARSMA